MNQMCPQQFQFFIWMKLYNKGPNSLNGFLFDMTKLWEEEEDGGGGVVFVIEVEKKRAEVNI